MRVRCGRGEGLRDAHDLVPWDRNRLAFGLSPSPKSDSNSGFIPFSPPRVVSDGSLGDGSAFPE
jgi:hypothetical protein